MARKCLFLCNREVSRFVDVNGVVLYIGDVSDFCRRSVVIRNIRRIRRIGCDA